MSDPASPEDPPRKGQFIKGQTGNPKGRPKLKTVDRTPVYDVLVDKTLMITRNGVPREITLDEGLQHRTLQEAIAGKPSAIRQVLKWIDKREKYSAANCAPKTPPAVPMRISPDPQNADTALQLLGIAALDPRRQDIVSERAQLVLEPWAVEAALKRRRGGNRLTDKEIEVIQCCVFDPNSLPRPIGTRT